MLPQSMAQTRWSGDRWDFPRSLASLTPANIALKASRETRALAVWLVICLLAGVFIAVGHVWLRIQVFELGYDLSATRSIIQKLEMESQSLTAQVETLESPARLEKVARARFDMVRILPGQQAVLP